jgi:exopolyphosphatase / guanosine-5'-triphosphate,3'-diphosphate pyrophosphatase
LVCIDIGSNTVRVVKYDCESGAKLGVYEKIVRTADKTHESRMISTEAANRVVEALDEAKEKLGFDGEDAHAVATAAFRTAKNAGAVIAQIKDETDISVRVIDGETEAFLTSLAVSKKLYGLQKKDCVMIVDIGGGSTEIIFKKEDKIVAQSFLVGIISLAQRFKDRDHLELNIKKECAQMKEFIEDCFYGFARPTIFTATAGTPTTLAAMKMGMTYDSYNGEAVNGTEISTEDVDEMYKKLLKSSTGDRAKMVGVGREDLIIAGIVIFKEIFELSGFNVCKVFDDGLREGLAIAKCNKIKF